MEPKTRFRLETTVFFLAALSFTSVAVYWQWFRTLDLALFDRVINTQHTALTDDLLIVGIDEQSLARYGSWPWARKQQAQLLQAIAEQQPAAVFLDFVYAGQSNPEDDAALVTAIAAIDTTALPVMVDALATNRQLVEVLPFPELLTNADVLGHIHVELDSDAIARGVYLHQGISDAHWPHVALALAVHQRRYPDSAASCVTEGFSLQNLRCDFRYLTYAGPPGTVPEISASDLLEQRIESNYLNNKTVFVGITASAAPDSITSPVSGADRPMAGVEFNANLYNSLVQDRTLTPGSLTVILVIALLCVIPPALLLPRLTPKSMLLATSGFAFVPVLLSILSMVVFSIHIPLAAAVITCLLSYPYWGWRRHEVAWQFVDTELSRLNVEKSRWVPAEEQATEAAISELSDLLNAEAKTQDSPAAPGDQGALSLSEEGGSYLVLTRLEPFSDSERQLVENLKATIFKPVEKLELPGEVLAARIRRLQNAARDVRTGREVGLRGLAEMPNGVAVLSALNRVLFVNHACRTLLELPASVEGEPLTVLVKGLVPPLGTTWREISREVIVRAQTISFETLTSTSTPVVVEAAPLADPGETADTWVITLTNMSDVRIAERDREEALAFLSHDLRSPMLSVLALVRGAGDQPPLEEIDRYAQKALSVSEQFLQLSRVQAREDFETYELDLISVIDNAIDQLFPETRESGTSIIFTQKLDNDDGAWIKGNGELLERTFVNLLTNAVKYSSAGSEVDIELMLAGDNFSISVEDHGIGIPKEEVSLIFDPFFRSGEPALAEQRGAGLGLRFVKTVVERHGGQISVSSQLGTGSRFVVTLPRLQSDISG